MKIELRIEDGNPIIFFSDSISDDKNIECYTKKDQHNYAPVSYMQSLKVPETAREKNDAWGLLSHYANLNPF